MVSFSANGGTGHGYLALPQDVGPGLAVIQEYWGLVPHITDVCDRSAAEGFVTLAPDLFHGRTTREPDEADKLLMELRLDEAAREMGGAVDHLLAHDRVVPKRVGSVGFCMGGTLALWVATVRPVDAAVTFYGGPLTREPDYAALQSPVLGHFAEHDDWSTPKRAEALFERLRAQGTPATLHFYPGTHHAFFNDARPEVHDPASAELAWGRTLEFLRTHLV